MYAKIVVVKLWHGFGEEIYCVIEHLICEFLVFPTPHMEDYSQFSENPCNKPMDLSCILGRCR
jgi:hypothetical protein